MVHVTSADSQKRQTNGFLVTISAILALFAKRTRRLAVKPKAATKPMKEEEWKIDLRAPKSPLVRPKKMLSNISSKALLPFGKKKHDEEEEEEERGEGWGNGGVWQKEILMGGKCEPLDFSGVIYYEIKGKQISEIPLRSLTRQPLARLSPSPSPIIKPSSDYRTRTSTFQTRIDYWIHRMNFDKNEICHRWWLLFLIFLLLGKLLLFLLA